MTWVELSKILQNMVKVGHTSLNDRVEVIIDGSSYYVDVIESLHTGEVKLIAAFTGEEDDADQE